MKMTTNGYGAWVLLGSTLLVGCVGSANGPTQDGGPEFPSRAALQDLARAPTTTAEGDTRPIAAVDDWQPGELAPNTEAETFVARLAKAQGSSAQLETAMSCTAREVARFYGAHQAFPDQQLQAHMAGVCGTTVPTYGVMVWATPTNTVASTEQASQWHDVIGKQLGPWLPKEANLIGGAELVEGQSSVFAATYAHSDVIWETQNPVTNEAGFLELSGTLRTPAAFIYGLSNAGQYGVQECHTDSRVAPPRFHVTCKLAANDSSAWIGLEALPPGRVLAHNVARVLMRRSDAPLAFTAGSKNAVAEPVADADSFSGRLLTLVNDARKQAGLRPLELSQQQSQTSLRLAPHYFSAGADANANDTVALGLMAGWDIKGTIQNGNFFSHALAGSLDPKRWLGFTLEQPSARRVLLDPKARTLAIGPFLKPQQKLVGALLSTYAFYESDDHRADLEHFVSRLNDRRRDLGLRPVTVTAAPEVAEAAQSVKTAHNPDEALQRAMQNVLYRAPNGVQGFRIEATDLDHVELPDALLRPNVNIALGAAHHRYPKAAWGTLVVLVVVLDAPPPQQTASVATKPAL